MSSPDQTYLSDLGPKCNVETGEIDNLSRLSPASRRELARYHAAVANRRRMVIEGQRQNHERRMAAKGIHHDVLCSYCGSPIDGIDGRDYHEDHVVATSLGGPDTPDNKVPSCAICNGRKSNKPFLVWLMEIGGTNAA